MSHGGKPSGTSPWMKPLRSSLRSRVVMSMSPEPIQRIFRIVSIGSASSSFSASPGFWK